MYHKEEIHFRKVSTYKWESAIEQRGNDNEGKIRQFKHLVGENKYSYQVSKRTNHRQINHTSTSQEGSTHWT